MKNAEQTAEPPKMCSKCGAAPRMPKRTVCSKCYSKNHAASQNRKHYRKEYRKRFSRLESWCRENNIKELARQLAR